MWLIPLQTVASCLPSYLPQSFTQHTHIELQLQFPETLPIYLLPPGIARRGLKLHKEETELFVICNKKEPSRSVPCQEEPSKRDGIYQMASGQGSSAGRNRSRVRGDGPGRGAHPVPDVAARGQPGSAPGRGEPPR